MEQEQEEQTEDNQKKEEGSLSDEEGCGICFLIIIVIALIVGIVMVISYFKEVGEDQVVEKTKIKLNYKPEVISVLVDELKPLNGRVFEKSFFAGFGEDVADRKYLELEDFRTRELEKAFALFDYVILDSGDLVIIFELYLLDKGALYICNLDTLVEIPDSSRVVDLEYAKDGVFNISHTFNEHLGSSALKWLLVINNLIWAVILGLYARWRETRISQQKELIAELRVVECEPDQNGPTTNS